MNRAKPNPSGLCMCGCGGKTSLYRDSWKRAGWVKGEPRMYLVGHESRTVAGVERARKLIPKAQQVIRAIRKKRRSLGHVKAGNTNMVKALLSRVT